MVRFRPAILAAAAAINATGAALLFSQTLAPDEVRVSSKPFVPQSATALRANSQFVEVGVVVRDARGRAIGGLKQSDFQILDDNKPQTISTLSVETLTSTEQQPEPPTGSSSTASSSSSAIPPETARRPRNVVIYFDDIHTEEGDLERAKIAASSLVNNGVEPGDRLAVFTGSGTVTQEFTTDAAKILDAISHLHSHPRMSANGSRSCPRIAPYDAFLITNGLDPIVKQRAVDEGARCQCGAMPDKKCVETVEELVNSIAQQTWALTEEISRVTFDSLQNAIGSLAKTEGDRVLVIASSGFLSDGIDLGYVQDTLISAALRARIIINSLDAKGLVAGGNVSGIKELNSETHGVSSYEISYGSIIRGQRLSALTQSMGDLASGTGGFFFENNNDLGKGFHRLVDAPAVEYVMTFAPSNLRTDGKFHKLQVKVANQSSDAIEARRGYYAPTKESEKAAEAAAASGRQSPELRFEREATSDDSLTDLSSEFSAQPARDKDGAPVLNVDIHIDLAKLGFQQQKDRRVQELDFIVALFDARGNFVTGKQGQMNLAFKEPSYDRFTKTGIDARFSIAASAGSYRLRAVAREAVSNKMYAASRDVEIR